MAIDRLLLLVLGFAVVHTASSANVCGQLVLRGNNGEIVSHQEFGRKLYPQSYTCVWRIQAPPGTRIRLFVTEMSVEYETHCGFDHVQIFDDVNTANVSKRMGVLCGHQIDDYFISSGPYMTLSFKSDIAVQKTGFSIRYQFVRANRLAPGAARVSRKSTGTKSCGVEYFRCGNGQCIPRDFLCDRVNDCGDHSDEMKCPGNPNGNQCTYDQYLCKSGKCIPYFFKCDGSNDCPDADDENCPIGGLTTAVPATTAVTTAAPTTTMTTAQTTPTMTTARVTTTAHAGGSTAAPPTSGCGRTPIQPDLDESRVVGGKVSIEGSWPFMVSLQLNGGHTCGGSIISPRWILTAAHCVEGYMDPARWKIYAGLHKQGDTNPQKVQKHQVNKIIVHPQWNSRMTDYDYTLMELKTPVNYNDRVQPICLGRKPLGGKVGCFVAGWGDTKGTGGAGYLKQAFVKTFPHPQCNSFYGGITDRMICAGHLEGGRDTCQGDSGGPLMCKVANRWEVHGITSFGGECAAPRSPGVYARVSTAGDWLTKITGL